VPPRTINLTFHGVGRPGRELDPGEDAFWLDPVEFDSVLRSVAGRRDVRLTFDDGNASDVVHGLPALQRHGLSATFFVSAGKVGAPGYVDRDGIRRLAAAGMAVGCHGMGHRDWRRLGDEELRVELLDARQLLEEVVDRPVTKAACPFGSYDRRVLRSLRDSGYTQVFTSDRGSAPSDRWLQPRNTVHAGRAVSEVGDVLDGEPSPYHALRRNARLAAKRLR
jgi:peptidoglycan/xylan/chitin deacetylase (PgdA/CDA1 family)